MDLRVGTIAGAPVVTYPANASTDCVVAGPAPAGSECAPTGQREDARVAQPEQPTVELTRPALRLFADTAALRDTTINDIPIGQLLPAQIQIAFSGTGRMAERALVPQTPAAAELLAGPNRERFTTAVRGLLRRLDEAGAPCELRGISLSATPEGFALSRLVSMIERDTRPLSAWSQPDMLAEIDCGGQALYFQSLLGLLGVVAQNLGWIDLGVQTSAALLAAVGKPNDASVDDMLAVQVLLHEIQHSITPFTDQDLRTAEACAQPLSFLAAAKADPLESFSTLKPEAWLEEAIAETITEWPDNAKRLAADMAMRFYPRKTPAEGYLAHVAALRRLLSLAGIDVDDPNALPQVIELLQAKPLPEVPARLAAAIAARHPGQNRIDLEAQIAAIGTLQFTEPDDMLARVAAIEAQMAGPGPGLAKAAGTV